MWFFHNPERLRTEVAHIEARRADSPWLMRATPLVMKGLRFAVDFDLAVNAETLPFTLAYPAFFPETPPFVLPRDGRHHSNHQWGADGELCLEYRTDNWDPAVTGAMMIQSAYRLLSAEQPTLGQRAAVPSAHQASLGQELRSAAGRAFLTSGLQNHVSALEPGSGYLCSVVDTPGPRQTWTAYIASTGPASAPTWREESIPPGNRPRGQGLLIRLSSLNGLSVSNQEDLTRIVASANLPDVGLSNETVTSRFTVLADAATVQFYCSFFHERTWKLMSYRTIDLTNEADTRLPDTHVDMAKKTVGIVGCWIARLEDCHQSSA